MPWTPSEPSDGAVRVFLQLVHNLPAREDPYQLVEADELEETGDEPVLQAETLRFESVAEAAPKEEPESPAEPEDTLDDNQLEELTTAVQAALQRADALPKAPPEVPSEPAPAVKKGVPKPPPGPPPPHLLAAMDGHEKRKLYDQQPAGLYQSRRHFELIMFGEKRRRGGEERLKEQ